MTFRCFNLLRSLWRSVWLAVLLLAADAVCRADDSSPRKESEQFPQSAIIARDRQVEAILEAAGGLLAKGDHAAAIAGLQGLLDGPNVFVVTGPQGQSIVAEVNRLLAEMPPAGRALYERLHGARAERLWQEARRSGGPRELRDVVARFGQTNAGWNALRDLAAKHVDRGEWQLAAAASERLSRHPHSAAVQDAGWIARWVLALKTQADVETGRGAFGPLSLTLSPDAGARGPAKKETAKKETDTAKSSDRNRSEARDVFERYRSRLEKSSAPANAKQPHLAAWLEEQLPRSEQIAKASSVAVAPSKSGFADGPAGASVWQVDAGLDVEPTNWLRELLEDWLGYDVLALPSTQPLVVGTVAVARFVVPGKIVAVDVRHGRKLWEHSAATSLLGVSADLQRHPGIRSSLFDELQRRWFGDSVRGRMTTDGRRLFLIHDAETFDVQPGSGTLLRNHLAALDLATGERLWRVGGSNAEPPTELQGVYFLGPPLVSDGFLYLVAQRETLISLLVLRADDGRLEWSLPLAESDRQQFKETSWRHIACPVTWAAGRLVCPTGAGCVVAVDPLTRSLAWSFRFERDDISSATGFAAADRERPFPPRWWESWREIGIFDFRFLISDLPPENDRSPISNPKSKIQNLLLIASPESRSLRAVDASTGALRWRVSFDEPLFAATRGDTPVLVFERQQVTAIEPATGKFVWRATASAPAAQGDWIGGQYVCPLQTGGWLAIDARDGSQKRGSSETPSLGGRLVRAGDRWMALSPQAVRAFEPFSIRQRNIAERLQVKPEDIDARIEQALLTQQAGDTAKAVERLRPLLGESAHPEKARLALRQVLLRHLADRPADQATVEKELLSLSREVAEQIEARQALIAAARRSGAATTALNMALELADLHPTDDVVVDDRLTNRASGLVSGSVPGRVPGSLPARARGLDKKEKEQDKSEPDISPYHRTTPPPHLITATRTVRRDRWLQGMIADLFADAATAERLPLEAIIAARKQRAADSLDAFALQQFADQLACLSYGRAIKLQLSGRTGIGLGYVRTSLALREIAGSDDPMLAAQAWYRQALLHEYRSEPLDAADCYRELHDRFADVKLPEGRSPAEWLSDVMPDSAIGRALANGPAELWPNRVPRIVPQDEVHDDIYCYEVVFESRDPFWRRMSVSVERQGRKVRFHGAGQRGFWDLPLPASRSPFRHAYNLHRGWGVGPLLVLQVGAELFGIQPLDDRGETNPHLLWTISVSDLEEMGGHEFRPGRLGVSTDDVIYLDRYEQPVLDVLHVGPGLLCYRQRNRLIAADPATGTRLWMRHRLPPRTSISADDEFVILNSLSASEIEVLRGFDGQLLSRRPDEVPSSSIVLTQGRVRLSTLDVAETTRRAVSGTALAAGALPKESTRTTPEASAIPLKVSAQTLRCEDLVTGEIRWRRDLAADSTPMRIDELRVGILERPGTLRVLALADGHELTKHDVALPASLSNVHCFGDASRLFVIIAGPVTEKSWLATDQDRGSYRKPLANGWLHAFDRRSLEKLWTIPARNLPIALDQSRDLPFLVLTYKRPSDDSPDGQHSDGVLHVIDKRTGKELFFDAGSINNVYIAVDPNPQDGHIDLLAKTRRIRLDFTELPPEKP